MARNALGVFAPVECEPLELQYLLSACREQGVEGEIYDAVTEHRRLSSVLASFRPDAVAVTGYLTQEREMEQLMEEAQENRKRASRHEKQRQEAIDVEYWPSDEE